MMIPSKLDESAALFISLVPQWKFIEKTLLSNSIIPIAQPKAQ
jgi:hypothetical protein